MYWLLVGLAAAVWWTSHGGSSYAVDLNRLLKVPGVGRDDAVVAAALVDQFRRQGVLTPIEVAGMLAVAYKESGFNIRARSADTAPDALKGHAWGAFQFTADTLRGLGIQIATIVPTRPVTDDKRIKAARASADAALRFLSQRPKWAGGKPYLAAVREAADGDPYKVVRDIFVSWAGGVGRTYASIADVPPNDRPGSLGYIHRTVERKTRALPWFLWAMDLGPAPQEGTS